MRFDILLRGRKVIDGKGNTWFRGDVATKDGRMERVGPSTDGGASEQLDIGQYFVCPGFIKAHTHSHYVLFIEPTAQSKVRQRVTTEVEGNCSMSAVPRVSGAAERLLPVPGGFVPLWKSIREYLEVLSRQSKAVNIAPVVGRGSLHSGAVGPENREATPDELARMKGYPSEGLEAGAFGMSLRRL
jgi:N-acyl-D-amino-acid deacylase